MSTMQIKLLICSILGNNATYNRKKHQNCVTSARFRGHYLPMKKLTLPILFQLYIKLQPRRRHTLYRQLRKN